MKKKVMLTFDLEFWYEGKWLKPYITPEMEGRDALIESMLPILAILKKNGHKATFFTTNSVVLKYSDLIKRMSDEGHEIASHSVRHLRLEEVGKNTFEAEFKNHLDLIESITGKRPKGFRAPHFSLNNKTLWLLPILKACRISYDSSIFPIKTPEYGVSGAPRNSYPISFSNVAKEDPLSSLIEIPQATLQTGFGLVPIAGGIYFRLFPRIVFEYLFKKALRQNTTPMLYFHPHELCKNTPKIQGPVIKTMLKYWGTNKSLKKFEKLSEKFEFDSIENILEINR
ncbi:MAG: polysaccharide deacetylase family protein [Patescibacteria group bacterium]